MKFRCGAAVTFIFTDIYKCEVGRVCTHIHKMVTFAGMFVSLSVGSGISKVVWVTP